MNAVSATATRPDKRPAHSRSPRRNHVRRGRLRRGPWTRTGEALASKAHSFQPGTPSVLGAARMVGRERRGGLVSVVNETSVSCAHRQADCGERGEQVQQTSLTAQSCPAHRPTSVVPLRGLGKPGRAITARPSPPPQSATAGENHPGEESRTMGSGNWYSGSAVCRTSLGRPRHCWVLVRTRGFPRYDRDADHRGVRRQPRHRSRLGHIPAFENIVLRPTSRAQWNTWTPNERLLAFITKVLFPLRGVLVEHSCIDTECTIITHIDRSQDTSEISLGVAKVTNPKHVAHSEQRN